MRWRQIAAAIAVTAACGVTTAARPAAADDLPEWLERLTISGYAFGDAYYFARHDDPAVEGQDGFWFRRIYLTFDSKLSDSLEARLRFEMASPGDFSSSSNIDPFVKNAYLKWTHADRELYLGISETPTFALFDQVWGYRSVEKSPLDLQRLGPSADFGVALKGAFDQGKRVTYHAMLSNGSGTKSEVESGKKAMLAVAFHGGDRFTLEAYGDVESRPGSTDRRTAQLFGVYQGDGVRGGVLLARQHQEIAAGSSRDIDLASIFGVFDLGRRTALLVRYDHMFDPNPDGPKIAFLPFDATAASHLVVLGLNLKLHEKFDLIPNVEAVFYGDEGGRRPRETLVPRLTFFWRL